MRVHAYFVFTCMALVTAFRRYLRKAEEEELHGKETGIGRFRRELEAANRDKVIVFCGNHFGIFKNWEMLLLLGVPLRERMLMGESAETVLARVRAWTANTS